MTTPHAFVSIKGVATCFDCGSGRDSDLHEGFEAKDNDLIGSLVASVRAAGLTLTYNGKPISEENLAVIATVQARRARIEALKLGQVVHLPDRGPNKAFAVVAIQPTRLTVQVTYCGSDRWYAPEWVDIDQIETTLRDSKHVKRAKRWLAAVKPDLDGWLRIDCGKKHRPTRETVGHVEVPNG